MAARSGLLRRGDRPAHLLGQPSVRWALGLDEQVRTGRGREGCRILPDEAPVGDDVRRVGQAREAARIVVDEDHGPAGRRAFGDRALQLGAGRGVQTGPRLVQHQQLGLRQQGLGDRDLLAAALRQPGHRRLGVRGGTEALQPLPGGPGGRRPGQPVHGAEVGEVAGGGEGQGRREPLGDVCRARPAGDTALAGGVDAGEQPQERGLAAAVGALDADEPPGSHREIDTAQHPGTPQSVAAARVAQAQVGSHAAILHDLPAGTLGFRE